MSSQNSPSPAGTAAPSVSNLSLGAAEQKAKEKSPELDQQQHAHQASATETASPDDGGAMRSRASKSNSPYIRSHATSPVHWQLLDDEAVSRAKRENKLIFLNVGFRACHCK